MTDLRIADAPEIALENITGNEKVPTGGYGNSAVTITNIGEFARTALSLATESYVSNAVGQKENKITLTGLNLTPTSTLVEIPQTNNSVLNTIHQDLLNRMEWIKDNATVITDHQALTNRSTFNTHPSSSISHNGTSNVSIEIEELKNDVLTINTTTVPELENAIVGKQDVIVNDINLSASSVFSDVPSTNNSALNNSLQALTNRDKFTNDFIKTGLPPLFDQAFADAIDGYPLNARLMLDSGDIVRSTIANNTNNPNSDMTGWVFDKDASQVKYGYTNQDDFNKKYRRLSDYINPSNTDHTASIMQAFAENDFLYLGSVDDVYEVTAPIPLRSGMSIKSDGAKFVCKVGIQGTAPYSARGIIEARNVSNVTISGFIETYIDHAEFSSFGDATTKPTIVGFLGDNCNNCDFGLFKSTGSVNYYYTPNFKEYGIVDLRNSTDCIVRHNVNGRYGEETASSTPSTVGVFGINNTRCYAFGSAKNCYWSGILWEGVDCKVINPVVRNTKGSNLNLAGINTNAYNVDLKDTGQGNVSIGEGADTCYSCSIFGGTIGDAQYANVSLHTSARNCKVFADIYGWGQIGGSVDDAKVGVRVRGTNNYVEVFAEKVRDGLTSFGWAVNCHSSTLDSPETSGNTLVVKSIGANVSVKSPNTIIDIDIKDAPTLSALDMGFRCAGSEIRRVRAENCLRPIAYAPNTGDAADYANVKMGTVTSVNCVGDSVMPVMDARYLPRARDIIKSTATSLVLNDVLYALEAYTSDSSITGGNKLAAAIKLITTDAFGTSYGVDILTSTISAGSLINKSHKFRFGSFEVEANAGSASSLICVSPDGTRYKLQPANGGGAATWVAV